MSLGRSVRPLPPLSCDEYMVLLLQCRSILRSPADQPASHLPDLASTTMPIIRPLLSYLITHFHCRLNVRQQSECVDGGWIKRLGKGTAVGQRAVAERRIHDVEPAGREPNWDALGSIRAFDEGKQMVTHRIEWWSPQQIFGIAEEKYPIGFLYVVVPVFIHQISDDDGTHDAVERDEFGDMGEAGKRNIVFPALQGFRGAAFTNCVEPLAHGVCDLGSIQPIGSEERVISGCRQGKR